MPSPGAVERALRRLEKLCSMDLNEILEKELEPILEREVEVAIQALLDSGEQLISLAKLPAPRSYAEIGKVLGKAGFLDEEEAKKLSAMTGLRDVLVHMYAEIDYELLYGHAKELLEDAPRILAKIWEGLERLDP